MRRTGVGLVVARVLQGHHVAEVFGESDATYLAQ